MNKKLNYENIIKIQLNRQKDREDLKAKSAKRVQNWPNTL